MARLLVQQVWASNLWEELPLIVRALDTARYAVLDTEFPGFLHFTPAHATPRELYRDVDSLKILQVGFSVFCHDGWWRNWQVNFKDFDLSSPSDLRWEPSVALLQTNGMNFEKSRRDGVPAAVFFGELRRRLDWTGRGAESKPMWVTFHGLYDAAYLVSLLTWAPLPESLGEFARLAGRFLGRIVDLKTVAESCGEASAGLIRTCKNLKVTTAGEVTRHQAGPQSTLTGRLFTRMMVRVLRERMEERGRGERRGREGGEGGREREGGRDRRARQVGEGREGGRVRRGREGGRDRWGREGGRKGEGGRAREGGEGGRVREAGEGGGGERER